MRLKILVTLVDKIRLPFVQVNLWEIPYRIIPHVIIILLINDRILAFLLSKGHYLSRSPSCLPRDWVSTRQCSYPLGNKLWKELTLFSRPTLGYWDFFILADNRFIRWKPDHLVVYWPLSPNLWHTFSPKSVASIIRKISPMAKTTFVHTRIFIVILSISLHKECFAS